MAYFSASKTFERILVKDLLEIPCTWNLEKRYLHIGRLKPHSRYTVLHSTECCLRPCLFLAYCGIQPSGSQPML